MLLCCVSYLRPEQLACVAAQVVRGLAHLQSRHKQRALSSKTSLSKGGLLGKGLRDIALHKAFTSPRREA